MYIWHILKVVIYVIFCIIKNAHSNQPDRKEYVDSANVRFTFVYLNINDTKDSSTHYCHTDHGKSIFEPKNGYGFSWVAIRKSCKDPVTIWKSNSDSICSNKVVFIKYNSKESEVIIYLSDGSVKKFVSFSKGNWIEINLSEITTVGISIESMDDSFAYTNNLCGPFRVFRIKDGFMFNGLYKIQGCSSSKYSTVWESRNPSEYASKIIVDGRKLMDKPKNATIFLINGTIKHYSKMGGAWVERSYAIELDINKTKSTFEFHYKKIDCIHLFMMYSYFKIKLVKDSKVIADSKNDVIWETKNPKEYATMVKVKSLGSVKYNPSIVSVFCVNGDTMHFNLLDNEWIEIEPTLLLDISEKFDGHAHRYVKEENKEYFIPMDKYLFSGIVTNTGSFFSKKKVDVWSPKDANDLSNKVQIASNENFEQFMIVYLVSGRFLVFYKSRDSEPWSDKSNYNYSIKQLDLMGIKIPSPKSTSNKARPVPKVPVDVAKYTPQPQPQPIVQDYIEPRGPEETFLLAQPGRGRSKHDEPPTPGISLSPQKFFEAPVCDVKILIDLDIAKTDGPVGYDIVYRNNKVIFVAKRPNLFRVVTCHDYVLWEYNGKDYPDIVLYKEVNGKPKVKVYFPDSSS